MLGQSTYSLMVIDDHPLIHEGLRALLENDKNLFLEHEASSATEALEILETVQPDLLIIDLSLGDSGGTYLIQNIHQLYPKVRMLVYSMSEETLFGERVAGAGARGYVMKTCSSTVLKKAMHTVIDGGTFFSEGILQRILKRDNRRPLEPHGSFDLLSNREMDVFKLIGEGLDTVHISNKLGINRNTVDTHRINIKNKLGLPCGKALDRAAFEVNLTGKLPELEE